jgi:hypothetical protein
MAPTVYILCGLTSAACAALLFRQYRRIRGRLLFWSVLCFLCLGATNILLYVDLVMFPDTDMAIIRNALTLAGMMMLLYGLILEST